MKVLVLLISTLISTQVFATQLELGKYLAIPKDFPTVAAQLELLADNQATLYVDAEGTVVNCTATYISAENTLKAHANCDNEAAPEINVSIDLTNVTPEGLRSEEGVEVPVKFDLLGEDPVLFTLKKVD